VDQNVTCMIRCCCIIKEVRSVTKRMVKASDKLVFSDGDTDEVYQWYTDTDQQEACFWTVPWEA